MAAEAAVVMPSLVHDPTEPTPITREENLSLPPPPPTRPAMSSGLRSVISDIASLQLHIPMGLSRDTSLDVVPERSLSISSCHAADAESTFSAAAAAAASAAPEQSIATSRPQVSPEISPEVLPLVPLAAPCSPAAQGGVLKETEEAGGREESSEVKQSTEADEAGEAAVRGEETRSPAATAATVAAAARAVISEPTLQSPPPKSGSKAGVQEKPKKSPASSSSAAAAAAAEGGGGEGGGREGSEAKEPVSCKVACLSWAGSKDGFKKTNQDAYCFMRTKDKKSLIFGVFDGHGPRGHDVSKFIKEFLPEEMMRHPLLLSATGEALRDSFITTHEAAIHEGSMDCGVSGTTAVVAHIFERQLAVAWAGDSRAVLARESEDGSLQAIPLSRDHKPELPEEKERVEAANGCVYQDVNEFGDDVGPFRVWMKQGPMLGLAMSRSLGDRLAHTVGVSEVPEVACRELDVRDKFVVLGSDGVFEFLNDEEVVKIIANAPNIDLGVKRLLKAAKAKWQELDQGSYIDDTTALVIGLRHN